MAKYKESYNQYTKRLNTSIICTNGFFTSHYENTPMQYTEISHRCKNDNFQMNNCDIFIIFAQNIDCGYTLEPPHLCFGAKIRKKVYPSKPQFYYIKVGCKGVLVTRTCFRDELSLLTRQK